MTQWKHIPSASVGTSKQYSLIGSKSNNLQIKKLGKQTSSIEYCQKIVTLNIITLAKMVSDVNIV